MRVGGGVLLCLGVIAQKEIGVRKSDLLAGKSSGGAKRKRRGAGVGYVSGVERERRRRQGNSGRRRCDVALEPDLSAELEGVVSPDPRNVGVVSRPFRVGVGMGLGVPHRLHAAKRSACQVC